MSNLLDTLKRAIIPVTALVIALLALLLSLRHPAWLWLLVPTVPVVLLGIYDWSQKTWTITRNFPVAGRIRWLFYKLRPYLRSYIVEDDLTGTPYSFEARNLVHARARGESDTHPFGTERDTTGDDYHWLMHSISPEDNAEEDPRVKAMDGIHPFLPENILREAPEDTDYREWWEAAQAESFQRA